MTRSPSPARRCASSLLGVVDRASSRSRRSRRSRSSAPTPTSRRSSSSRVGLLCGSLAGRVLRLRRRPVPRRRAAADARRLVARLVAIGYCAGRLRELRDPQGALVPLAVGAAATAVATVGYSLMQFLLGVDAPVELRCCCARSSPPSSSTRCSRCPVYALVRRWLLPAAARGPAPPPAPRLHDRRPLAALARMIDARASTTAAPPITPAARAARRRSSAAIALALFAIIFFRLWYLQVLSGDQYLAEARDNRVREVRIQAPRGDDRRPQRRRDRRRTAARRRPDRPAAACPPAERDAAPTWGQRDDRALRSGPKGQQGRAGRRSRRSPTPALRDALRAPRRACSSMRADDDPASASSSRSRQLPYARRSACDADVPATMRNYLVERHEHFPGVDVEQRLPAPLPASTTLAAQLLGTVGEISPSSSSSERFRGVKQGTIVGQGGLEYAYDRYLRGRDGATRITVDALGQPEGPARRARRRVAGRAAAARRSTSACSRPARRRSTGDRRGGPARRPRSWR